MSLEPINKILDGMIRMDIVKVELVGGTNSIGIKTTNENGQVIQYVLSTHLIQEGTPEEPEKKEEKLDVKN